MSDDLIHLLKVTDKLLLLIWAVATVMGMGLGLRFRQVLEPLRNIPLVARALLANYVLVPLLAWLLGKFLPLSDGFRIGLMLAGIGAGAPVLPLLCEKCKGNRAWAAALMLLLTVVTVVYMPLVLPPLSPGAKVDSIGIARSLILIMLLPLVAGLLLRSRKEPLAIRLVPIFANVSKVMLLLALLILIIVGYKHLLGAIGRFGILAAAILVLAGTGIGYVLGGRERDNRVVLAFATGARNITAALAVAASNFSDDQDVALMCILVTLAMVGIQLPLAKWLGRRRDRETAPTPANPLLAP